MSSARAILLGWGGTAETVAINSRYIRFTFISDTGTQDTGWNIDLLSSTYSGGSVNAVPVDTALQLYDTDFSKIAEDGGVGAIEVAKAVWDDASNNALVVRV